MIKRPSAELQIALAAFLLAPITMQAVRLHDPEAAQPSFHIDEAHKIAESYYYHLFFETRDWGAPAWSEDFFARTNPPVAKYIFGVALALGGEHVHDQGLQRTFNTATRNFDELRAAVPDEMLAIARFVSGLFGALLCALMAAVATRVGGVWAGIVASLPLVLNPVFLLRREPRPYRHDLPVSSTAGHSRELGGNARTAATHRRPETDSQPGSRTAGSRTPRRRHSACHRQ